MFVIGCTAKIGDKTFRRVHSVEVEDSIKNLGRRCTIKIPATARIRRKGELTTEVETAKVFKVGDEVTVNFGYDGDLKEEFRGFVRKIRPTIPLEIECEDAVYLLKRKSLKKSFRNVTLSDIVDFAIADTGIEVANEIPKVEFRTFLLKNTNAAQVLEKLRKTYGLTIYFREFGKLVVGLASETDGKVVKYEIGTNVISHKLEWTDEADKRLKIKAVSVSKDNKFTKETVGDEDGEVRTLFFYDLKEGADLGELAKQEILKYKYSGYEGDLTGFLIPVCRIGNTLNFTDATFENREGDYLVEKVVTKLSTAGGRRKITLGLKLD